MLITILFSVIWMQRLQLDYDSEGRFLSPEDGVVYYEDAVLAYGFFTVLFGLLTLVAWIFTFGLSSKKGSQLP
jgi:hypothetical protein